MAFSAPTEDLIDEGFSAPTDEVVPDIQIIPQGARGVNLPSEYSSGLPANVPISENPDWGFTKATRGGLPGILSDTVNAIQSKIVEPVAAGIINTIPFHKDVETGKPMIPETWLPLASEKGFVPALSRTLQGFSTPGTVLTLPFAAGSKAVQKIFLTAVASSAPESIQKLAEAQTPDEIKDAATTLGVNAIFAAALSKGLKDGSLNKPTEVSNAREITSPESVSQPEIRPQLGEEAPLRQQGEVTPARGGDNNPQQGFQAPTQDEITPVPGEGFQDLRPQEVIDLESELAGKPPTSGGVPLNAKMQEQLNAADVSVSSGMQQTILAKKIKSPVALRRVFPNLKISLEEAQSVLNQVWGKNDNVPAPKTKSSESAKVVPPEVPSVPVETQMTPQPVLPETSPIPAGETVSTPGGAIESKTPAEQAQSAQNNSRAAFEAEQAKAGLPPLPNAEKPSETSKPPEPPSDDPFMSRIANRFSQERSAVGDMGEIAPGKGYSPQELVARGLKMKPEEVSQHISDLMNKKDGDPVLQGAAVRVEEARLSQKSQDLSRIAEENPLDVGARQTADDAFKEITKFHEGPVAKIKTIFHGVGEGLQGEIPVDLSTFNGLREQWLRDNDKAPPPRMEPEMRRTARNVRKAVADERDVTERLGKEINRVTRGRKLPSPESVRDSIIERMKDMPCRN